MRGEYKHFTRVNQNLALIVEDLRLRQEGLTNEVKKMRDVLERQEGEKKRFKDDVNEMCNTCLADHKKLKRGVISLHKTWVLGESKEGRIEKDSVRAYETNRRHFENSVKCLKNKIKSSAKNHKEKNSRIIQDNVLLIDEINLLRMEKHRLSQRIRIQNGEQVSSDLPTTISESSSRPPLSRTRAKSARVNVGLTKQIKAVREDLKAEDVEFNNLQMQLAEAESQAEQARENLNALLRAKEQGNNGEETKYDSSPERMEGESPSARAMYQDHS
jgi:hypothetical protein